MAGQIICGDGENRHRNERCGKARDDSDAPDFRQVGKHAGSRRGVGRPAPLAAGHWDFFSM
jgi:hypothetical protein